MRRNVRLAIGAVSVAIAAGITAIAMTLTAGTASAAVFGSSDRWATWTSGSYTLYNNVWGSGYGPQSIWANTASNWGVWSNQPATGGIKSYPNATRVINRKVSALGTVTSSFNVTVPTSGVAFETAYDIWSSDHKHEIMLWMNKYGAVGPLGTLQTTATVGGHTWSIYKGSNGANAVYSFLRSGNTSAGTVNVTQIAQWIKSKGWFGDVTISEVQFGYEITSSAGGKNFVTNSFSVSG